jgi:hypothetical protein
MGAKITIMQEERSETDKLAKSIWNKESV